MARLFIQQVRAGIIQELQVYKHRPLRLLGYFSTVFLSALMQLIIHFDYQTYPHFFTPKVQYVQVAFYFGPAWVMISDMAKKRESNLQNFTIANGMKRSAYIAKLLISNYILMLIVIAEKTIEYSFHRSHMYYNPRPLDQLLIFYFVLSTATVNLCLLFSRCFKSQQTMSLCIIIFIILPGINFSAGMLSFQWFLGYF